MKTASTLQRENGILRALLKEILDLHPEWREQQTHHLMLSRIQAAISDTDGRTTGSGFARPAHRVTVLQKRAAKRADFQQVYGPTLRALQAQGLSLAGIAEALNEQGIRAPMGGEWTRGTVKFQLDNLPPE